MAMQKNLNRFERAVRLILGIVALFAAWQLFTSPIARLGAVLFAALAVFESLAGFCWLHSRWAPSERLPTEHRFLLGLLFIQTALAYEWWSAGWEKLSNTEFVTNIPKTLGYFASGNPFPWYRDFLAGFAASNAQLLAYAIEWGEVAVGVALFGSAVAIASAGASGRHRKAMMLASAALAGGLLMNANFYFAAAWTGAGTKGSNVVMILVQAALFYVWLGMPSERAPAI